MLPGPLTPTLQEGLVRLGGCAPFAEARRVLAFFTGTAVGVSTARRLTERAGAAYVAVQTAEVTQLEREAPVPPTGPPVQLVSVDGAMVPLRQREWAEVKTLAIGTVTRDPDRDGAGTVRTTDLSYFSRLADAEAFTRLARVETERRGTEPAGVVAGVVDGAPWCQSFLATHRPDAVRILDFPHAVEHLNEAAPACFGAGTGAASAWLGQQRHARKHDDPGDVLAALRDLPVAAATDPVAAEVARDATLGYLAARREQIRYAAFAAQGLPIGSGAVESANKRVVEARLKGTGMRWAREQVDPMVALRTAICSERWEEAWPPIARQVRAQARHQVQARRTARRPPSIPVTTMPAIPPPAATPDPALDRPTAAPEATRPQPSGRPKRVVNGRPTDQHPWKQTYQATRPSP